MFDLKKEAVHAVVSKMIINEELMASLDEPSECMVMHRTEPSRLQSLSLQLSDKIAQLVENNERLLELRPGGWQGQWRKDGDRRDGQNQFRRGEMGGFSGRGGREGQNQGNFRRDGRDKFGGDRKFGGERKYSGKLDGGKFGDRSNNKKNWNNQRNQRE